MQVKETEVDELTRQFRILMPAADIELKVEARLSELARTMRLPGFRPGKVPLGLMRKRYGAAVKSEVVEQTINESSQAVISERGLRAALPPKVELVSLPEEGELEYTLAVELLPEITPPEYAQISLERLVASVDQAEIERRLARFADAVGQEAVVEDRPAADDDIVVFDMLGPIDDPWPFDPEKLQGIRLRIGSNAPLPGFDAQLVGLSARTRTTLSVAVPEGTDRADLVGQLRKFEIEVKEVRVRTPAPIDDELAQKGGWESLVEFKAWLCKQHDDELKSLSRLRLKRLLLDRLAELYNFAVPKGLVQREYESLVRQHQSDVATRTPLEEEHVHDEHCEHDHDHSQEHVDQHAQDIDAALSKEERTDYQGLALRRVRLGLLLAEIGRTNNLRVQQDELAKAMIAHARRFSGQEEAVLEFLRRNPEAQEALAAPILEEKVVDFILEMAKVSERVVDPADLLREQDDETTFASDTKAAHI